MVAGSILPIALNEKGELCFLFGKENPMEDSAKGFSDFGGSVESGETVITTAYREGSEELSGFLGTPSAIQKLIKKRGGFHKMVINDYHIHIFSMEYDVNLPKYFTNFHKSVLSAIDYVINFDESIPPSEQKTDIVIPIAQTVEAEINNSKIIRFTKRIE